MSKCKNCGHDASEHYEGKGNCMRQCDCPEVDCVTPPEERPADHPHFCRCARCKTHVDALRAADDEGLIDEDPPPTTKRQWQVPVLCGAGSAAGTICRLPQGHAGKHTDGWMGWAGFYIRNPVAKGVLGQIWCKAKLV